MKILLFFLIIGVQSNALAQFSGRPGGFGARPGSGSTGSFGNNTNNRGNQSTDGTTTQETPKKGKVLDDSTKQVYGPKTVRYFLEEDIFNNRKKFYEIDTSFNHIHRFNFLQKNNNEYQDLGNIGTAARPVFFQAISQIGTQLGYNVFDIYAQNSNKIQYFDTKSPFTNMEYATGGRGDQMLKFDFNRNVNSRWNIGLKLQDFVGSKQYGSIGSTNRNSIRNWNVIAHSSYFSKDSTYTLLVNYNYFNHRSYDDGGVIILDNTGGGLTSEDPIITTATTLQIRKQLHCYQQYKLANGLQLYHILDIVRQNNSFIDRDYSIGFNAGIYKTVTALGSAGTNTIDSLFRKYRLIENKVGLKGYINGFNYRAHFRRRDYQLIDSLDHIFVAPSYKKRHENFVGGWLNYYFKDSTKMFAETEYLIGKDFNFRFEYQRKNLSTGFYNVLSSPTLMQELFYSHLAAWNNKFNNSFSNTFYGKLTYHQKNLEISPSLHYSIINNNIYFDTLAVPKQNKNVITILQIGTVFNYRWKKVTSENQVVLTAKTGPNLIRIPPVFINSRLIYHFRYAKKLDLQLGLEIHYKAAYNPDAYLPAIQQFYLQDKIKVKPGVLTDIYLNTKINRVRLSVKYAQLNNLIFGDYFVGPKFKGLKGGVSFGVFWPLFD